MWGDAAILNLLHKLQRCRIHAIAQPGRLRTVVEYMPQVRVALGATYRCPHHAEGRVSNLANILFRNRSPEARPSRSRLKLRVRAEQSIITAHATVQTFIVHIPVLSREGSFRVCAPGNVEPI